MNFRAAVFVWAASLSLGLFTASFAQRSLSFKTSLEISGMYEHNPWFSSESGRISEDYVKDSYAVQYSPSLSLIYTSDIGSFSLNYKPNYKVYYPSGRKNYSLKSHDGELAGTLHFTDKLSLALSDRVVDSLVGAQSRSDVPSLDRRFTKNSTNETVRYTPGTRLVFTLGHRSDNIRYRTEADKRSNREDNSVTTSIGYRLGMRTELGVTGDWGLVDNKTENQTDRYDYSGRVYVETKLVGIDTTIRGEGGFETTRFKNQGDSDEAKKSSSSFSGLLRIARDLGEDTRAQIVGSASYLPSDQVNGTFYKNIGVDASVRHLFLDRIEAMFDGGIQHRKYEEEENPRRDYAYRASAKLGYRLFKWLAIRGGYTFSKVDSTIETYEYDEHVVEASVYVEYSFAK